MDSIDSLLLVFLGLALVIGVIMMGGIGLQRRRGLNHVYYKQRWQYIEKLRSQGDAGWHSAIIEADKLLDEALKARGMSGQTMGERLKSARRAFAQHNDVIWQAHKLRNRIAHESGVRLNSLVVTQALRGFRLGLKDMGAL